MDVRRWMVSSLLLVAFAVPAQAGEGVAVIVAVGDDGAGGKVATAEADAQALEGLLTDLCGYPVAKTSVMMDASSERDKPTLANVKARIEAAAKSAGADDRLLVYITCRAAAAKEDVTLVSMRGAGREGVSLAWVVETLSKSPAASKMVVVDASCADEEAKGIEASAVKAAPAAAKVAVILATGSRPAWVAEADDAAERSTFSAVLAKGLAGKADIDGDYCVSAHELELWLRSDLMTRRFRGERPYGLAALGTGHGDPQVEAARLKAPELDAEEKKAADEAYGRGPGRSRAEQAKWYTEAIRRNPRQAGLYYDRGFQYFCLSRGQEAWMDWTRCLELDPKHSWALNMRGNLLVGLRLYDEALADLDKAIEIEPDLPLPYNHRGRVYSAQGKLDLAVENFTKGIELLDKKGRPDDEWLLMHLNRARAYYRLKEYDKAWADVKFCREKKIPVPEDFVHDLEEAGDKGEND